jgi:WD40-like Beta Propeller Repeat
MRVFRLAALSLLVVVCFIHRTPAAPRFSAWSAPENLGPGVNSAYDDSGGALSKDGLTLYFTSTRPGGFGGEDLWVAQRASTNESFVAAVNLGSRINTAEADRNPSLSRDEHWLLFASARSGGFGNLDLWVAYREHTHDDFGWLPPVNLGPGVNTASSDTGPSYLEGNETRAARLYFARAPGGQTTTDIWVSEQAEDGAWETAVPVPELNTAFADAGAEVRHDGLEILIHSTRPGSLGLDLWAATRDSTDDSFSEPINLGVPVNSVATDRDAGLSAKRTEMVLSSDRPGGFGMLDLYVSTRFKSAH